MDSTTASRFDAAAINPGPTMTKKPSAETMFVAEAMACFAIEQFATNLAAYLAGGVEQPGENGTETVERLLAMLVETPLLVDITDYRRDQFDADKAQAIALEKIGEFILSVRERAL